MTHITPDSVPRAARRPRARLAALSAALLTAAALMLAPVSASADTTPTPGPSPSTPAASPLPTFTMAPADQGVVRADGSVTVGLSAANPASTELDAAEVRVERGDATLSTRDDIAGWLAGDREGGVFTAAGATTLAALPARGTATVPLTLDPAAFTGLAPGVYPLRATYATARGDLVSFSTVIVPATDRPAGPLTVIIPITAGALTTAMLTADELTTLTAPDGLLRAQLDAVRGSTTVLAIDPAIAVAIRALGASAPATAVAWLDDLLALPNERFALQFGDADLAAQVGAGLATPLSVGDVDALAPGLPPAPTPTPTATPGALPEASPTLDGIGTAIPNVLWPASGSVGAAQVATLGAVTEDDDTSLTLVASSSVSGAAGAHAQAGDAELLVYDSAVSDALRRAGEAVTGVAQDAATAEAAAYSALTDPTVPLAVTVDRSAALTAEGIAAATAAATGLPGRTLVGLSALRTASPEAVTVADTAVDEAWVTAFQQFRSDAETLGQFATILADPALLTVPDRARTLQVIGNAWHGNDAWPDAVAAQRERTAATLTSVELVPVSDINLLGTSAPLSFTVRNDLPFAASLVLYTVPNDPRIIVQTTTTVEAGAAQATRVNVPVEARVGSGEAELSLQLRSPAMVAIGDEMTVTVNVRAEWEQIGVVVLSVLVGAFLVIGVIRTVRRRRRRSDPVSGEDAAQDDRTDADG